MRRHLLGVISVILLIAFVTIYSQAEDANDVMMSSVCLRAGLVLGALWLAFPQVLDLGNRYPPWLIVMAICMFCIFVVKPKLLLLISPLLIALGIVQFISWMFKPPKKRPRRTSNDAQRRTKQADTKNDG